MDLKFARRALSVAAFGVPLIVYIFSLMPSVGFWDTGEMQTVPFILGIAHPTGFPLFVLLGYVFSHLVVIGDVAWRLSLMSAIAMAGATWLIFRTLRDDGTNGIVACLSAWTFAFGAVVWTRGTRAEVHALVILLIGGSIWAALRFHRTGDRKPLFACALCLGLGAATHPVMVWALPGIALLLLFHSKGADRPGARDRWIAAGLALTPFLLYLYMPLRSAYVASHALDPTQTLGLAPSQAFWNWGHPADSQGFARTLLGSYYAKWDALVAILHPALYPSMAQSFAVKGYGEFSLVAIALAIIGVVAVFFKDFVKAAALMLVALAGIPFALNFAIETDFDRYLLTAFWVLALFAGYGAQAIVKILGRRAGAAVATAAVALLLFVNTGYTVYANRATFAQRADHLGDAFIDRTARLTQDHSIIVATWIYATPLAYGSYVEHRLGTRTIVSAEPNQIASFIRKWRTTRPVYAIYFQPFGDLVSTLDGMRLSPIQGGTPTIYRVVTEGK